MGRARANLSVSVESRLTRSNGFILMSEALAAAAIWAECSQRWACPPLALWVTVGRRCVLSEFSKGASLIRASRCRASRCSPRLRQRGDRKSVKLGSTWSLKFLIHSSRWFLHGHLRLRCSQPGELVGVQYLTWPKFWAIRTRHALKISPPSSNACAHVASS